MITRTAGAFLFYCVMTLLLARPLVSQMATAFPHDPGDPALNTWILWWNARNIPYTDSWWNAPAFYPVPGVLSFSEHLLGLSLISTPVQWAGGSALLGHNIAFLLTFPLCAIGAYLLALEVTKRFDAALVAGLLFGFAPYRMSHLPHIQVLAAFPMPFALVGLHRYIRDGRARWLALFGAAWLVQALCNGYFMLFFGVLVMMWMFWFVPLTSSPKKFVAVAATLVLASLPLVPLMWRYQRIHSTLGFVRDFGTMRFYGADLLAFLSSEPALSLWGWLQVYRRPEGQLFPGLTLVLLLIAGVWVCVKAPTTADTGIDHAVMNRPGDRRWKIIRRALIVLSVVTALVALAALAGATWELRPFGFLLFTVSNPIKPLTFAVFFALALLVTSRPVRWAWAKQSTVGFYAIAAFVMWLLSLGPAPTLMGEGFLYRGPYALLMGVPGFSSLRVPARFWMISLLCLSVVGAIIFSGLASRLSAGRRLLSALVILGVLADGWIWNFPVASVPASWVGQKCAPPPGTTGAVMELPLGDIVDDVGAMYRSIAHTRPTVNGYSGYFPPHYSMLRYALNLRDQELLGQLAAHGVEFILIERDRPSARALRRYTADHDGAELVCADDVLVLYRLKGAKTPAGERGRMLPISSLYANVNGNAVRSATDGDLTTRWDTGPQESGMMLEIDLGSPRVVSGVELSLGSFTMDFPRGLRIEASEDRTTWQDVWRGSSAGRAVIGALRDRRVNPLVYDLPSPRARYLRLWLTRKEDVYYWSVAELKVFGS
jgi:hypothetical protein